MVLLLLVDDDKDMLRFLSSLLESRNFSVTTCTSAHEALEKLKLQPFDIILSDANMPGASGFDLVKTIRADERFADLGIALLTGRREKKDVERGLKCGADDYIVKPVDPDILFHKLEGLLKKRPPTLRPTIHFAESKVRMPVEISLNAEIESLSEVDMHFLSQTYFQPSTRISLTTRLFKEIGINPPFMRVQSSEPFTVDEKEYFRTRVSFIGLNEAELQKLRSWVHYNSIYKKGAA